jgi:hypothetical protein
MTKKSNGFNIFLQFQKYVERFFNTQIKLVQSDWGGEYRTISTFFKNCGIVHRVSCPHTYQQQGSIERKHRHVVETGLSLLSHAHMPLRFWDDAFQTACFLINRLPTPVLQNKSPFEKLFNSVPDYLFLKTFGCACWPNLQSYNSHKLQPRSLQCVFLGYSLLYHGYKCLHIPTGRLYISRDVIFLENLFPFFKNTSTLPTQTTTPSGQSVSILGPCPLLCSQPRSSPAPSTAPAPHTWASLTHHTEPIIDPSHHTQPEPISATNTDPYLASISNPTSVLAPETSTPPENSSPPETASNPLLSYSSSHPMITRSKNHITKPKPTLDGMIRYPLPKSLLTVAHTTIFEPEPTCFITAAKSHAWRQAMNLEFDALLQNQTWTLVLSHPSQNLIGCKWVFRVKRTADGSIERHKARLVAKGFHQQSGVDYDETYSPVIKPTTVRTVLSIAISSGWSLRQIDIQNAFLHGNLLEEVFMSQPPGYQHPLYPNHVCKLQRAIYGLKQAPRAWFSHLSTKLLELGFHGSRSDSSLFIYKTKSLMMYILIYVDDIIITSSQPVAIDDLLRSLTHDFAVKDLGTLNFFLGLEVISNPHGILLSQQRYIMDLLLRTKMSEAKPINTPMASTTNLSAFEGEPFPDHTLYRSTVGSLQYLALTRPDIVFTVNKLSQFMQKPLLPHWQSIKRLLRYLKNTIHFGL